uniref:Response regulatory domain-containing protein n=1 Tax=Thermosporothrix sp. COM3 TaxID=2490863 RepID=A0A455SYW9_9CHLR|nr:hypothetical protein KTC_50950 [Thermosporothrix sp. COM3]
MSHRNEQAKQKSSKKTILLVEDDENIGEVLIQVISEETPYIAILATDGFEALKTVNEIKPDLFILDYHLPHMNGLELYDQLHARHELSHVPAIMISARLPKAELHQRHIQGMHKPLDLDEFLQAIDELLT